MPTFPKHLRVAITHAEVHRRIYTFTSRTPIHKEPYQFLQLFSKFLNFSYSVVLPEDGIMSQVLKDGNWTGAMGILQRGEADMSFQMTEVSHNYPVDFTLPVKYDRITFMTQKPQPILKNFIIFQPFTGVVWAIILLSTLLFFSLFCVMNVKGRHYVRTFFATLGNILGQPFSVPLTTKCQVLLFVGWILTITFLILSFKSVFLSFLLAVPTKGINTIDELASAVADRLVKCKGLLTFNSRFMHTTDESYRIIHRSLLKNYGEGNAKYLDPYGQRTCYVAFESSLMVYNGMLISKDSFFYAMRAFPMRKNFQGKKVLEKTITRMHSVGLLDKIMKDFYFKLSLMIQPLYPTKADETDKRITLEDFAGAFLILVAGLSLALLVLLGEILFFNLSL